MAESESQINLFSTRFNNNIGSPNAVVDISSSTFACDQCQFYKNFENVISVSLDSSAKFISCNLTENYSANTSVLNFYANKNTVTIANSLFSNNFGQIMNVFDSDLEIRQSLFENCERIKLSGMYLNSARVNFYDTDFSNLMGFDDIPYIELISNSWMSFQNSDIINLHGIYLSDSELNLENVHFYVRINEAIISSVDESTIIIRNSIFEDLQNQTYIRAAINMVNQINFSIDSSKFTNFKSRVIEAESSKDFSISNCVFENGSSSTIYLYDTVTASINYTKFVNNYSNEYGGAIQAISSFSTKENKVQIRNCEFENNEAENGGAIYATDVFLHVDNSYFNINKADYGGSVYLQCNDNPKCYFYFEDNIFQNNIASYIGGSIYWTGKSPFIINNTNEDNQASYGNNIGSFPTKISVITDDKRELNEFKEIASGQLFPYQIKLGIYDAFSELVAFGFDDYSAIMIGSPGVSISGETKLNPTQGIILFQGFNVTSKPGESSYFLITLPSIKNNTDEDIKIENTLKFKFNMRECLSGESEENDQCVVCKRGFYSFKPSQKCTKCPNNAICYGKNIVAPDKGY